MADVRDFYDELAPLYHLVYENRDASVTWQGAALASLIREYWPGAHIVLDAAIGIGTQGLGLAAQGFSVSGSDLSLPAVRRASREAASRGLRLRCVVADFQELAVRAARVDVVIVCDNSLPHLESELEIGRALRECLPCVRPGGGCVISVRDYGVAPEAGTVEIQPYGERTWDGRRYDIRQVWRWQGPRYDLSLEIAPTDGSAPTVVRTSYLAIPPARVAALMTSTGFVDVRRIDGRFFQPILVGTRPPQR